MLTGWLVVLVLAAVDPSEAPPSQPSPPPTPEDIKIYDKAKQSLNRNDSQAQVRLALWCEAHGLEPERLKHLALAVLKDPKNVTARGLMGLVAYRGKWQRPESVSNVVKQDEAMAAALAEYNGKRLKTKNTADGHWKLALWCETHGLAPEALAHYSTVIRLDPTREGAWKRLGFKKHGGQWVNEAKLAEAKAETERQKQADQHWKPLLEKWRNHLGDKTKRAEAEEALGNLTDPRAVRAVWMVFAKGNVSQQAFSVRLLSQIDASASSKALAFLALSGSNPEIRRAATETLRRRDPREFAGLLIAMLRDPIQYEVRPVGGPGSPGAVFVKGERFNVQRLYSPPPPPFVPFFPGDYIGYDIAGLPVLHRQSSSSHLTNRFTAAELMTGIENSRQLSQEIVTLTQQVPFQLAAGNTQGFNQLVQDYNRTLMSSPSFTAMPYIPAQVGNRLENTIHQTQKSEHKGLGNFGYGLLETTTVDVQIPIGVMMLEAQKAAVGAQMQLQNDVAAIDAFNQGVTANNDQVALVLDQATEQSLGTDRTKWNAWWINQLGYAYRPPTQDPVPTYFEEAPLAYQPQPVAILATSSTQVSGFERISCFGAGTLVRTLDGMRPIESLEIGDQVLTQNMKTGALGYQPIIVVHRNPPSPTFKITLGDETIVSSHFHRFWKAGKGWVMARDLKAGDTLRTLGGLCQVTAIESGSVQPVFNLDVAEDADFFVGQQGALVHDNTLPDLRLEPFDAVASLNESKKESR